MIESRQNISSALGLILGDSLQQSSKQFRM